MQVIASAETTHSFSACSGKMPVVAVSNLPKRISQLPEKLEQDRTSKAIMHLDVTTL
jgi:hypothetical protein